ncbi:hypothetical protein [Nostoc sp. CCY0012]|uniref:hypothetical protein n=1 Tax=Nostoc sp. CCY0012 TaxID=1056123 RepID=UPI0039C65EA7
MTIKTITYQRVLNLGNYESKRLEMTAEISEGDDPEAAASHLIETVERKVREDVTQKIKEEIRQLKHELWELNTEISTKKSLETKEPDPDDIPFDSGENSPNLSDF